MFSGSITALVTPFKGGSVDWGALRRLVEFQIANGCDGLVPCGTTGESATLTHEEHVRVIETVIEAASNRVPVIAGTGSNSTAETVMLTAHAARAGAAAALLITPYYNRPTQNGLYEHYRRVAEETDLPLILYNVPGRTGVNMLPETVARLSEIGSIVGIKEATGDLRQVSDIIEAARGGFIVLSGDDFTTLPLLALGGRGVISVTANVAPKETSDMVRLYLSGDSAGALEAHFRLAPLNRAMFIETNPMPVKTALAMMGMVEEEFRLPLVRMTEQNRAKLQDALRSWGLVGPGVARG
jgi:4-hydroxy-tetrahydrodipicolinate synthase